MPRNLTNEVIEIIAVLPFVECNNGVVAMLVFWSESSWVRKWVKGKLHSLNHISYLPRTTVSLRWWCFGVKKIPSEVFLWSATTVLLLCLLECNDGVVAMVVFWSEKNPLLRGVSEPVLNVSEGEQTGCVMEYNKSSCCGFNVFMECNNGVVAMLRFR